VFAKINIFAGDVRLILTFGLTYWVLYLGPALALIIIEMLVLFLTIYSLRISIFINKLRIYGFSN